MEYGSLQRASLLCELTCHMVSHSITQPIKAGTQFSDPGRMQGWVDLVAGLILSWYTRLKMATRPSTNQTRHMNNFVDVKDYVATTPDFQLSTLFMRHWHNSCPEYSQQWTVNQPYVCYRNSKSRLHLFHRVEDSTDDVARWVSGA